MMDDDRNAINAANAIEREREIDALRAEVQALRAALADAEFLMRKAGAYPGAMQDSFKRSSDDARTLLARKACA